MSQRIRQLGNFVANEFVGAASGGKLEDIAPAIGKPIAVIPRSQDDDIDTAVEAAVDAFPEWARTPATDRADLLDAIADVIETRQDELAELESADTGKPITTARQVDIPRAVANFRFFAGAVRHDETSCHEMAGALNYTIRRPLGPVALITPWNLPLYLLSWKTAPALAMGNTVVCKPSELTPQTANALAEIMLEVKAPAGIFNVMHGLGPECGQALVEHPGIRAVSFTGGTATGSRVAAAAAPVFKKLSLELGGKNPTIVFADCDFDSTVEGVVRAGFTNTGQVCLCGSRILVQAPIAKKFTDALVERVKALRIGDPADTKTQIGALISAAHREKVEGYIGLAKAEGGRVLCGGERPTLDGPLAEGFFLEPTVIDGLAPTCRAATDEIFGPVVTVHPFETESQAVSIANSVRYGLSASVWTTNLTTAHRVSAALDTGMVWVNTWLLRDLRVPFGGVKDSGVGREGGRHSLDFFSEQRNVCVKL